jgi:hypothetical protein
MDLFLTVAESKDPEFARGSDDAIVTFLLMAGAVKEEAYSDPDIVAAKEAIPSFREATAFLNGAQPRHPDEELASAFIYLRASAHKEARYSRQD